MVNLKSALVAMEIATKVFEKEVFEIEFMKKQNF